jgi:quinol monooxygenase YgiN
MDRFYLSNMDYRQITMRAEVTIEEGKIEEYKQLAQEMSKVVEDNQPDTLIFQFYFSRDETKSIVWETFTNSESVLIHMKGVAAQTIFPKISNVCKINRVDMYGNPSEELQKAITNLGPQIYNHFIGFSR